MDELESRLGALLSSPESMERLKGLAAALAGVEGGAAEPEAAPASPAFDPAMLGLLQRVMGEAKRPSEASALLAALEPCLSPERAARLDRALRLARLAKLAKTVLPQLGGELNV